MILDKGGRKQRKPKKRTETLWKEKFFLIESRVQERNVCGNGTMIYPCSQFHQFAGGTEPSFPLFILIEPSCLKPTWYTRGLELFYIRSLAFSLWSLDKCGIFRVSAIFFPGSGFTVIVRFGKCGLDEWACSFCRGLQ